MKKHILLFFISIIVGVSTFTNSCPLWAADIVIIKSNNITPYNQAIEGFRQEIGADIVEYDLQGKSDNVTEVIDKINKNRSRLIFALGALAAVKAKENIFHIPIIYSLVLAPENKGMANRNLTGICIEVDSKQQFSVLKKVVPQARKIGVLYSHLTENKILKARKQSRDLGLELVAVKLRQPEEVPDAIKNLLARVDALWLVPDSIVVNQYSLHYMLMLTMENGIPFMVYNKGFVRAGALLSPVVDYEHVGRQAGQLARQILKGKTLPGAVLPPAGVEWAINLYIAQNMGLQVPKEVLALFKHIYK